MNIQEYVKPELLVLIPVLYLIGAGLKRSKLSDRFIPAVLGLAGVLLAAIYVTATTAPVGASAILTAIFTAITQGILAAGASVYVNQLVKQSGKGEDKTEGDKNGSD